VDAIEHPVVSERARDEVEGCMPGVYTRLCYSLYRATMGRNSKGEATSQQLARPSGRPGHVPGHIHLPGGVVAKWAVVARRQQWTVETTKESNNGGKGITKERIISSSDDYPPKLRGDGGGKRSRRDNISDFEDLVRQAGYTIGSEETIGFFLNGLTPSILDEVIKTLLPTNYNEYKGRVVEITQEQQMIELIRAQRGLPTQCPFNNTFGQNRNQFQPQSWANWPQQMQPRQQPQQRLTYNSTNVPHPAYNNIQVPMDLSHTRMPYNRRQYTNNTYTSVATTDNQEEQPRKPHPKGPCFHCRKLGHFIRDYRSWAAANINYLDTQEEDMQNIPQPTISPRINVANLKAQIDSLSTEDNNALIKMMGSAQDFTPA
jgi:hypothetical protein